jgi:hypothetical protein
LVEHDGQQDKLKAGKLADKFGSARVRLRKDDRQEGANLPTGLPAPAEMHGAACHQSRAQEEGLCPAATKKKAQHLKCKSLKDKASNPDKICRWMGGKRLIHKCQCT